MAKIYTAQEMREKADALELASGCKSIAAMLRQAADALEREEKREVKYEYAARFDGELISTSHLNTIDDVVKYVGKSTFFAGVVRRPVGEWEEVRDGE